MKQMSEVKTAINLGILDQICLYLLQDEEFGLEFVAETQEEKELIHEAIALIKYQSNREDWTEMKQKALLLVGSPVADVVSRISSAQRTPDIALSGLRDGCEKFIEIAADATRKRTALKLRDKFKAQREVL
jgi:hypothetical protein